MSDEKAVFHASIEGAQHGPKGLADFLEFAKRSGARGAQPSNSMLMDEKGFLSAATIKQSFREWGLQLDGISAHCPFWVHGSAWTGTKAVLPFVPEQLRSAGPADIEAWAEKYILQLLNLCAELGVRVVPMFWGLYYGLEVAGGYPWGFWQGPGYDLIREGDERFLGKTQRIREKARALGIVLCHEIHPGTAAQTADDFLHLARICSPGEAAEHVFMGVNFDPSHCWDGEPWDVRLRKVGSRVFAAHMKDHRIIPNRPLRSMEPDWKKRGMQFTPLGDGDIDLVRVAETLIEVGYPQRYCGLMGTETAPLVVEAEAAFRDGDDTSTAGIAFIAERCCFPVAAVSFENAMGEKR